MKDLSQIVILNLAILLSRISLNRIFLLRGNSLVDSNIAIVGSLIDILLIFILLVLLLLKLGEFLIEETFLFLVCIISFMGLLELILLLAKLLILID